MPLLSLLFLVACDAKTNNDLEETQRLFDSPEGCFSCQFFKIIYTVGAEISTKAYDKMCDSAFSLLIIGMCGLPFPSPGDLPDPGIEPGSPAL